MTIRHLLSHTSGLSYGLFGMSAVDRKMQEAVGSEAIGAFYSTLSLSELIDKICNKVSSGRRVLM